MADSQNDLLAEAVELLRRVAKVRLALEAPLAFGTNDDGTAYVRSASAIHKRWFDNVWPTDHAVHVVSAVGYLESLSVCVHGLLARVRALEEVVEQWQEREASVCPEDVGFEEYIATLTKQLAALSKEPTNG